MPTTFVHIANAADTVEMLALARRIRRKCDAIRIDTTVAADRAVYRRHAEEIGILAAMIEQRLGGEHA